MRFPRSKFRLEHLSGAYANHVVYAGGVIPKWNWSLSQSIDSPDPYVYDVYFPSSSTTGALYYQGSVPQTDCGYREYTSCQAAWNNDPRVYFFGGLSDQYVFSDPVRNSANAVWYYDPSRSGSVRTSIYSYMNYTRVNPHVIAFNFQYLSSTLTSCWMVMGDDVNNTLKAEFFVSNPAYGSTGAFNHWKTMTGSLQGSHIKGAAVKYPNESAILLFGGSGTNGYTGAPQTVCTERLTLNANLALDPNDGTQTLSFGSVKLPSAGQLKTERYSFAHGIDQIGRLWVVGGLSVTGNLPLSSTEIFDFNSETWSVGPTLPRSISYGQMIVNSLSGSDEIIVIGGSDVSGSSQETYTISNMSSTIVNGRMTLTSSLGTNDVISIGRIDTSILNGRLVTSATLLVDNSNTIQSAYSIRLMNTGSGWTSMSYQPNEPRARGYRVAQIDDKRMFIVGGEIRTSTGGWITDAFAVDEISIVSGAVAPSFVTGVNSTNIYTAQLAFFSSKDQGLSWLPLRGLTFSKVTLDGVTSRSFDVINDLGGIKNPYTSSSTGTIMLFEENYSGLNGGHQLVMTMPDHFVMNGCTMSLTTPSGIPYVQGFDYMQPSFSGSQLPANVISGSISGSTSITWSGWNMDHGLTASFYATSLYGTTVRFQVPVTSSSFSNVFTTPNLSNSVGWDPNGNPAWIKQGTTHSIDVTYQESAGIVQRNRSTYWVTPSVGPRPHYRNNILGVQDVSHQWLLNETTLTTATLSLSDGITGGKILTSGYNAYNQTIWMPNIFYGTGLARVIPTASSNGIPGLNYNAIGGSSMLQTFGTGNLTIEFWYYVDSTMGGPTNVSWQEHVGLNKTPIFFSWNPGATARVYPTDTGNGNRDVSNLSFIEVGVSGTNSGHGQDIGLYVKWEIGNRFNWFGTLYGPTVVVAQTTVIPPLSNVDKHHVVIRRDASDQNAISVWIDNGYQGKWYPTIAPQYQAYDVGVGSVVNFNHFGPADGYTISSLPSQFINPAVPDQIAGSSGSFFFGYIGAALSDFTVSRVVRNSSDIMHSYYQGRGVYF